MANKIVPEYNICVAFATVMPSCQIEWEVFVLVIGDQSRGSFVCQFFTRALTDGSLND